MKTSNSKAEDANEIAISRLGFSIEYWYHFFGQGAKFSRGFVQLPVSDRFHFLEFQAEILYIDGRQRVPSKSYYEHNLSDIVNKETRIYLFQSSVDALAYFQIRSMIGTQAIFISLGKNPDEKIIEYLSNKFYYAKFILCFPNRRMSKISEIRTAALLTNKHLTLEIKSDHLICGYKGRKKSIPFDLLSLSRVSRLTGFYPKSVRTQKPPKGFESFYEFIRSSK